MKKKEIGENATLQRNRYRRTITNWLWPRRAPIGKQVERSLYRCLLFKKESTANDHAKIPCFYTE